VRNYYRKADGDQAGGTDILDLAETYEMAQEQAALRRLAGLVAREPTSDAVFAAVNREIGLIVRADATTLFSFHDDDTMTLLAAWSTDRATFPLGDRRPMNPPMLEIRRTGVGRRFDVFPEGASFLEEARAYGVRSAIAVPLLVEDDVWGVVFVNSREPRGFPAGTEDRVLRFTALAGIAIAHARARATLAASRARVLAAADASRRQVQRDLHDGAQQRLVHTILGLKLAREAAAGHDCAAAQGIEEALRHAERARAELHDLVRGVLPASLTLHGLRAALESLADHLPLTLDLDVDPRRLPGAVETAAYFVVAEALTNVVKHAGVDAAAVRVGVGEDGDLRLEISDRGAGGADTARGTGLRGLADRVEAGGGSFEFDSPPGGGTTIRVSIPLPPG
jgi:signal transduction histidine kinase